METTQTDSVDRIPPISNESFPQVNSIFLKITARHPYKTNRKNSNIWWRIGPIPMNVLFSFPTGSYELRKGVENGVMVFYLELRPDSF